MHHGMNVRAIVSVRACTNVRECVFNTLIHSYNIIVGNNKSNYNNNNTNNTNQSIEQQNTKPKTKLNSSLNNGCSERKVFDLSCWFVTEPDDNRMQLKLEYIFT